MKNAGPKILALFILALAVAAGPQAPACTRVLYQGPRGLIITGRTMDWDGEIPARLWLFPRGMERTGEAGENSVSWKSRYGSIVVSSFDIASVDGMNEEGLAANLLWLAETAYPDPGERKALAASAWVQYMLDNFASVEEAVREMRKEELAVVSANLPGTDRFAALHLSLSDAWGDSAIFEYVDGKLAIHHGRALKVMANSPVYQEQMARLARYRQGEPGIYANRFIRANLAIEALPEIEDTRLAAEKVFTVIRGLSVTPGEEAHATATRWRCVADQKNLIYYFETAGVPGVLRMDIREADLSEGAPVKSLDPAAHPAPQGNAVLLFTATAPFRFAGLPEKPPSPAGASQEQ